MHNIFQINWIIVFEIYLLHRIRYTYTIHRVLYDLYKHFLILTYMTKSLSIYVLQGCTKGQKSGGAGSNAARRRCPAAPSDLPKSGGGAAAPRLLHACLWKESIPLIYDFAQTWFIILNDGRNMSKLRFLCLPLKFKTTHQLHSSHASCN